MKENIITTPSKIIAVGLNYKDHAKELEMKIPDEPCIFLKAPTSMIKNNEAILYPPESKQVDYEGELAIIIKREAYRVREEKAKEYILGYTCANDVTARDLQKKDGQWARAKSFNAFCPLGPVVTDEIDPDNIGIKVFVNKELRQHGYTSDFIFKTNTLVAFISNVMTLYPGDVILTGTPSGVGHLDIGDTVEVVIDGIGVLSNIVKKL